MIQTIKAGERYHFETDWLSTYWHFSFDHYYDPKNTHFGPLRVFNDDIVQPGGGFPLHGHREMEILTYVLEGRLEHQDSLGNRGVIGPGELQRMSAGTGIRHSEYNASREEPLHLLQLWIEPDERGLEPSWEQRRFTLQERQGGLLAVASGDGLPGTLRIHQDASVYVAALSPGEQASHEVKEVRRIYLFVIKGGGSLNGETLDAGDQARVSGERRAAFSAREQTELILLDLP
jgi:redox-sensitive bicupin YhaK (pirin superfamily)